MFVYIHLPFCLSHCIYCDFYVELKGTLDRRKAYLEALKQEIGFYLSQRENPLLKTIYFGGGTPGLFLASEIAEILDCLKTYAPISPQVEITLEANPEGMASAPAEYLKAGINRLSIGVQSLQPNELKRLSRIHSRDQVFRFLESAKSAGFQNISIDLMYGIPEQTKESWQDTLNKTANLGIQHISMYGLKVEDDTQLAGLIESGRMSLPIDEITVEMYLQALTFLEQQGFSLYEISNLARPGYESRHNLAYWDNQNFWGFGVSAHGYMDNIRYENPRDLAGYLQASHLRAEEHLCSEVEQRENFFIFGLRKRQGVSLNALERLYGVRFEDNYQPRLQKFLAEGLLFIEEDHLKLSTEAIPLSNEILMHFLD